MRCAIYARYSSDLQKETSIEDQVRNCRQAAKQRNWTVLEAMVCADRGISASSLRGRLQLARLLDLASSKPRPFDYLLVDDTSRLSRNKIDQLQIIEDFRAVGVNILFVSQSIDTADEQANDVVLPIHGIVDSLYLKELAKKTKRGMAGQVLNNYNPGGRLYGYSYRRVEDPSGVIDKKSGSVRCIGTEISVDPDQAKHVLTVFRLYDTGCGYKEIANYLNERVVEPPGAPRQSRQRPHLKPTWCPTAIRAMLRNPHFNGDWTWNKHKWYTNRRTGKRAYRLRPKEEWVIAQRPDLKIVPDELWQRVQERVERNRRKLQKGKKPGTQHLLTGFLKCGTCGSNMILVSAGRKNAEYVCTLHWHRGPSACPNTYKVKQSEVEAKVLQAITEQLAQPYILGRIIARVGQLMSEHDATAGERLELLKQDRDRLNGEINNLAEFIARNGDRSGILQEKIDERMAQIEQIERQLLSEQEGAPQRRIDKSPDEIAARLRLLPELAKTDVAEARVELHRTVDAIKMTPRDEEGKRFFDAEGKMKLQGILGDTRIATLLGSGDRI